MVGSRASDNSKRALTEVRILIAVMICDPLSAGATSPGSVQIELERLAHLLARGRPRNGAGKSRPRHRQPLVH